MPATRRTVPGNTPCGRHASSPPGAPLCRRDDNCARRCRCRPDSAAWNRVSTYDQSASRNAEYRVVVDILRFESVPGEGVTIEALWSVKRGAGGLVEKRHSIAQEPADGTGYEALVAAHGRALATICKDMARALTTSMSQP
ncbi:MAG: PqiC family protein [Geobacteraceae bacterium]|nr:PqiC family protein [Geobacteraceae bacterium]